MILLSNCLTDVVDEGCLKVANSLANRLKRAAPDMMVLSINRRSKLTDVYLKVNKLFLNRKLIRLVRERREPVLYLPFPTRPITSAYRIFLLSLFAPDKVDVVVTMTAPHGPVARTLLKMSGVHLYALSRVAASFYADLLGEDRVTYLKTGVDTAKFSPVTPERVVELKKKYNLDPDKKVILHVGHMKAGRNIAELMKLDEKYQVLLVVSTFTRTSEEPEVRGKLEKCPHIRIMDGYYPDIEEIYQLSDAYFFPVLEGGNCIDVPLSCLEAASCRKPVITTAYGEMREFVGKPGFYLIDSLEKSDLNRLVDRVLEKESHESREAVLEYDWNNAAGILLNQ